MQRNSLKDFVGAVQPTSWIPVYSITPEIAEALLLRNLGNRKIRPAVVDRYARDLIEDRWHFIGDPLVIDENGHLRQGQHRLLAIIKAGKPMDVPIVFDVPARAFAAMDTGSKRSTSDQLKSMYGVPNPNVVAAIIPRYLDLTTGKTLGTHVRAMSPAAIVAWYEENQEMHDLLGEATRVACAVNDKLFAPPSTTGACYAWIKQEDPEGADEFFRRALIDGYGWNEEGSPARTLGQFMSQHKGISSREYDNDLAWSIMRCWHAWVEGDGVKILRPRKDGVLCEIKAPVPRARVSA